MDDDWIAREARRAPIVEAMFAAIVSLFFVPLLSMFLAAYLGVSLSSPLKFIRGPEYSFLLAILGWSLSVTLFLFFWGGTHGAPSLPTAVVVLLIEALRAFTQIGFAWLRTVAREGARFLSAVVRERYRTRSAVLASILVVSLVPSVMLTLPLGFRGCGSRASRARGEIGELANAVRRMRTDTDAHSLDCLLRLENLTAASAPPACGLNLPSCVVAIPGTLCWGGPYYPRLTTDPWKTRYVATFVPQTDEVVVTTLGANQRWDSPYEWEHDDLHSQ